MTLLDLLPPILGIGVIAWFVHLVAKVVHTDKRTAARVVPLTRAKVDMPEEYKEWIRKMTKLNQRVIHQQRLDSINRAYGFESSNGVRGRDMVRGSLHGAFEEDKRFTEQIWQVPVWQWPAMRSRAGGLTEYFIPQNREEWGMYGSLVTGQHIKDMLDNAARILNRPLTDIETATITRIAINKVQELHNKTTIDKEQHDITPTQGEETPESTGTSFFSDGEIKPICTAQPGGARPAMADGGGQGDQGAGDQRGPGTFEEEARRSQEMMKIDFTDHHLWWGQPRTNQANRMNTIDPGFKEASDQRIREINNTIMQLKELKLIPNAKDVSDGYHTFQELYDMRLALTVAMLKPRANRIRFRDSFDEKGVIEKIAWRSRQHSDGTMFDGMFIVGYGIQPGEFITFHYHDEHWDKFNFCEILDKAPEWDGHTDKDVIERLLSL